MDHLHSAFTSSLLQIKKEAYRACLDALPAPCHPPGAHRDRRLERARRARADAAFPLHGVIKRVHLLGLLKHRIGLIEHSGRPPFPPAAQQVPASQARRWRPPSWCSGRGPASRRAHVRGCL